MKIKAFLIIVVTALLIVLAFLFCFNKDTYELRECNGKLFRLNKNNGKAWEFDSYTNGWALVSESGLVTSVRYPEKKDAPPGYEPIN